MMSSKPTETFVYPEDAEAELGVPTLGFIPMIDEPGLRLIRDISTFSPLMESYRTLRTNLRFVTETPLRSLLITSAVPAEGKSTTATNLAMAMAMSMSLNNKSLVLVDGDLRRPSLHRIFKMEAQPGLTNLLVGMNSPAEVIRPTVVPNLSVICAGSPPPNPTELLESNAMAHCLRNLTEHFDFVLVDSPPTLAVADAAVLGAQLDGVLMVVGFGETKKDSVRKAIQVLKRTRSNVLGTVLSRMGGAGSGFFYGKYYVASETEPAEKAAAPEPKA